MANTWNINGTNNTFGIDSAAWNSIRTAEKLAVGRQYAAEHGWSPISPLETPMYYGYIDGGYYDDYGNLLEVSGGGGQMGVGTGGMNSVGAPNSGGGAGSVGSGYGYAQPGAGLSPINSGGFGGAGQGIYDDASMYRGGDFWGGGSDPYAGTQYAGGGGGGGFDPMRGGYVTADAPARGSAEWYGAGYDMIPDNDYSSARDFTGGAGYGGYSGGGGGSPSYDAGPPTGAATTTLIFRAKHPATAAEGVEPAPPMAITVRPATSGECPPLTGTVPVWTWLTAPTVRAATSAGARTTAAVAAGRQHLRRTTPGPPTGAATTTLIFRAKPRRSPRRNPRPTPGPLGGAETATRTSGG
jgi:hypothetical protein